MYSCSCVQLVTLVTYYELFYFPVSCMHYYNYLVLVLAGIKWMFL